jgi:hypothetical protein
LDFSPFSVVFLGRSANDNKQIKLVCAETLDACFGLTPNLEQVCSIAWMCLILQLLLGEALDPDLDFRVLSTILNPQKLPKLEALDRMSHACPAAHIYSLWMFAPQLRARDAKRCAEPRRSD